REEPRPRRSVAAQDAEPRADRERDEREQCAAAENGDVEVSREEPRRFAPFEREGELTHNNDCALALGIRLLIVIANGLHCIADGGADQRALQRFVMRDRRARYGANDRAASLAVVMFVSAMVRRREGVSGGKQQCNAEHGCLNAFGNHRVPPTMILCSSHAAKALIQRHVTAVRPRSKSTSSAARTPL